MNGYAVIRIQNDGTETSVYGQPLSERIAHRSAAYNQEIENRDAAYHGREVERYEARAI